MKRSLLAFQALLASSAILCQTAEASSTYNAPDQVESSLETRIEAARSGDWSNLLNPSDVEGELVAKSKWGNGGYHGGWRNGGGGWKNGGGGFVNW